MSESSGSTGANCNFWDFYVVNKATQDKDNATKSYRKTR